MGRFGLGTVTVHVDGEPYEFRALTVAVLEGLVAEHGEENPRNLNAALISASSADGKLADVTPEELDEWPMGPFRRIVDAITKLNGLGEDHAGN